MADTVVVQEVAPVKVTRGKAVRIWIGRFIVDYVETFLGIAPATLFAVLVTPAAFHLTSITEAKLAILAWGSQLLSPAFAAFVSAGRRAALAIPWGEWKAFVQNGFSSKP